MGKTVQNNSPFVCCEAQRQDGIKPTAMNRKDARSVSINAEAIMASCVSPQGYYNARAMSQTYVVSFLPELCPFGYGNDLWDPVVGARVPPSLTFHSLYLLLYSPQGFFIRLSMDDAKSRCRRVIRSIHGCTYPTVSK
ncbi:hypothetical protein BaRGS_00019869 [Batillaria attramentaria]|uniref:Uncharacterized protein n=1 Tax=Batillaria attramentaria TaxID=370345 RepID=A0ABD0KNZ0_9CAEN